uniref:Uncharacterized protein n=1 Tax=Chromera velia CCMP2878 TaxID=1169474 RepID=A0A0G4G651_9ALVE|eukprot:Cvel_20409.t1-p1 / transcript=Cvel_20409.t1 / gene=Cvel_20409 / organism=Chromera_velia_CCMP2878 / gene_product=hypothetical protein / transcript_product=hypothetical protein / location=Cvel_scaffold1828:13693-14040(-) / protein_length=116 / sequence_SO=supercontig / SO=protein_coding / is_pseudo=false
MEGRRLRKSSSTLQRSSVRCALQKCGESAVEVRSVGLLDFFEGFHIVSVYAVVHERAQIRTLRERNLVLCAQGILQEAPLSQLLLPSGERRQLPEETDTQHARGAKFVLNTVKAVG